jgi:hypothetical protein
MTTVAKIGSLAKTAINNTEVINGIQHIDTTNEGFEIIDRRPLKERIYNPIQGRSVKRQFSNTHFVVTESLFEKLTK